MAAPFSLDAASLDRPYELFGYAAVPAPGAKCPLYRQTVKLVLHHAYAVFRRIGRNNFQVGVLREMIKAEPQAEPVYERNFLLNRVRGTDLVTLAV